VATITLREPVSAYVALGANLGDAAHAVKGALACLDQLPDTQLVQASALLGSAPVDAHGPAYVNAVAHIQTRLNAVALLQALQGLENAAGRTRHYLHAPRTLDLDLLFYGEAQMQSAYLTLPHPRWQQRAFVLLPLQTVCAHKVSPQMLEAVAHQSVSWLTD
jgi:2-amino-4-hydroxy-6-hydroxymethyldihydropteridine diphosphokinase